MADKRSATVILKSGMEFEARANVSGHSFTLDASEDGGGHNSGPRPLELFLMGLGGCTGMDVISLLRKMRQEVVEYRVQVDGDRSDCHPKVYTEITVEHVVKGRGLSHELVRKAVELSATRYCPASAMLSKAAKVTHSYRLVDADTGKEETGGL